MDASNKYYLKKLVILKYFNLKKNSLNLKFYLISKIFTNLNGQND